MSKFSKTELVELFFHEVDSYIPGIRRALEVLSLDRTDAASGQELHRLYHNIKGAASQVQLADLSKGAKIIEDALAPLVDEELPISDQLQKAITKTTDLLLDYKDKHNSSPGGEFNFYQQVDTIFGSSHPKQDSSELHSYLDDIRSIFTMLQELVGYLSDNGSDLENDKKVYGKLSHAVSLLSRTVQSAGMQEQGKVTRDFHHLLEKLHSGAISDQPEMSGLMADFLQFLQVAFSYEDPENVLILTKVKEHFHRVKSLLDIPLQSEVVLPHGEDVVGFDGADFFEDAGDGGDTESIDFFAGLSEAEFVDDDLAEELAGGVQFELEDSDDSEQFELKEEPLSEDQQLIFDIFNEECEEHLAVIHQSLEVLEAQVDKGSSLTPELKESISGMRRAVHTLKGAAAMTGLELLPIAAGSLEHLLDWINDQAGKIDQQEVQMIVSGVEVIELLSESPQIKNFEPLDILVSTIDEYLSSQKLQEVGDLFVDSDSMESLADDLDTEEEQVSEEQQLLMEIFREECDEHLIVINQSLNFLENKVEGQSEIGPELKEAISEMRRAVHTLKGAASMTGVNLLAQGAHSLEDMLDWLHDESDVIQPQDVRLIARGIDVIELLSQSPDATKSTRLDKLIASVDEYMLARTDPDGLEDGVFGVTTADQLDGSEEMVVKELGLRDLEPTDLITPELPSELGTLRVRLEDLDELVSIEGELVVARGAVEKMMEEFSSTLVELDNVKENLRRKSQELEAGFEVQSLYGFNPASNVGNKGGRRVIGSVEDPSEGDLSDFDPIELDRYSQLNLIIRSLNEISVDVNSIHATLNALAGDISGQVGKQQLTMRLMQEKLMRIRMTPLSSISRVLFRTVRDTSDKLGKKVALTITGEDVYMDRFVWTRITDPLMHILRNGVDHGIESSEVRQASGKQASGTINLQAEQRSRYVVLRISDDGGGVDLSRVRDKIKRDGLAANPEALSNKEVLEFLFNPSFSTRQDITTISGRGVGLDVVRRNIQDLRGSVQLHNRPGQGVVFEIQIPFTLSVNRAVLVSVAGREFAIPLQDIQQVKHFYPDEIDENEGVSVTLDDKVVPLVNLGFYLQLEKRMERVVPGVDGTTGATAILFQRGDEQYAVAIDYVEEQREIIVKDLGSHLTHVPGISGVTLTGTGGLIPILNLRELVDVQVTEGVIDHEGHVPLVLDAPLKVLIVDDSISVRHSVARLVESQSWLQQQAVDGLDALAKLENYMPDVIILDIEMPRMNGYEFKSSINNQQMYKDIPVVMLTSRVSEKHQQKARDLGIHHYLTKPYQDEVFVQLLENIKSSS